MVVGSLSLSCRRFSLRCCDDSLSHNVQTTRYFKYRNCALHKLALFAVGYKTFLESDCRPAEDEEILDNYYAVFHRCGTCRSCTHSSNRKILSIHTCLFLAACFQLSYTRHSSRWILYAWFKGTSTIIFCWNKSQHFTELLF